MKVLGVLCGAIAAAALAGCSVSTAGFNSVSSAGGAVVGSLGLPAAAAAVPPPPATPALGAFLEGPVGTRLVAADRDRAYQAELDALAAGDRKTWRGDKGAYGYVTLSGDETPEGCRGFSHTVYIGGRPQTGKGTGCKSPEGTWRITG